MEETDTLQKYYSCFLLPRPRREHHCAEDTETSGRRMLHIHKWQNRVTAALSEQEDERPLEKWSCVSKKSLRGSVTGGWILLLSLGDGGFPRERKCGDVSSGTWWGPIEGWKLYKPGGVSGNVAVPSGSSPLNYAQRTHSALFAHLAI